MTGRVGPADGVRFRDGRSSIRFCQLIKTRQAGRLRRAVSPAVGRLACRPSGSPGTVRLHTPPSTSEKSRDPARCLGRLHACVVRPTRRREPAGRFRAGTVQCVSVVLLRYFQFLVLYCYLMFVPGLSRSVQRSVDSCAQISLSGAIFDKMRSNDACVCNSSLSILVYFLTLPTTFLLTDTNRTSPRGSDWNPDIGSGREADRRPRVRIAGLAVSPARDVRGQGRCACSTPRERHTLTYNHRNVITDRTDGASEPRRPTVGAVRRRGWPAENEGDGSGGI